MNLQLSKQTKNILLSVLVLALLIGVSYGAYVYWQSQQITPTPTPTPTLTPTPQPEKAYEIIKNPDGSQTFICYKFGFKFDYPEDWEFSENRSSLKSSKKTGWVEIFDEEGENNVLVNGIIISIKLPRNKSQFPTFREYVVDRKNIEVPNEPNTQVSGVPAFKYVFLGTQTQDSLIYAFEYKDNTFYIYIPLKKQNDLKYLDVVDSFEFIN